MITCFFIMIILFNSMSYSTNRKTIEYDEHRAIQKEIEIINTINHRNGKKLYICDYLSQLSDDNWQSWQHISYTVFCQGLTLRQTGKTNRVCSHKAPAQFCGCCFSFAHCSRCYCCINHPPKDLIDRNVLSSIAQSDAYQKKIV